jgi:hypothetical protein
MKIALLILLLLPLISSYSLQKIPKIYKIVMNGYMAFNLLKGTPGIHDRTALFDVLRQGYLLHLDKSYQADRIRDLAKPHLNPWTETLPPYFWTQTRPPSFLPIQNKVDGN